MIGQQPVVNGLYAMLSGDSGAGGVATLATGGIFNGQAPEVTAPATNLPHVQFTIVADADVQFFPGPDLETYIQIDTWGSRYAGLAAVRAISDRIYQLLNDQTIPITGLGEAQGWLPNKGRDFSDEDAYRIMQELRIKGSGT